MGKIWGKFVGKLKEFFPLASFSCFLFPDGLSLKFKELQCAGSFHATEVLASEAKGRWFDPSQPRHFPAVDAHRRHLRTASFVPCT